MNVASQGDPLFDLANRSILIAGGAGGLGAALARSLSGRGARLFIADLNEEQAHAVANELGEDTAATSIDVTDPASCAKAIDAAVDAFGCLDGLVNATGVYRVDEALHLSPANWRLTIDVNLTGAFQLAQAAGRIMVNQGSGRIITISSVSSAVANPHYAAYAASKAGVAHLTRILALEWAHRGVTVNAIGPAVTPTPLTQTLLDDPNLTAAALARIPMGRFGSANDLTGAVVFLLSKASEFMTGQTLYVDGGRTLN